MEPSCESYGSDECPTDTDCVLVTAQPFSERAHLWCGDGEVIVACRSAGNDCSDDDAEGYYCEADGTPFWTPQQCGPKGTAACSPPNDFTLDECPERINEADSGGVYDDYCGAEPDSWLCDEPPYTIAQAMDQVRAHPDLPSEAFLVYLTTNPDGGMLPDGRMAGSRRLRLWFYSETDALLYDVEVNSDDVRVGSFEGEFSDELSCTREDEIEWRDIPAVVPEATQQALAYLDWELQLNQFILYFDRRSECLWTDWGLSYLQLQQLYPDEPGLASWTYVEYAVDGELTQVCGLYEEDCIHLYGERDW